MGLFEAVKARVRGIKTVKDLERLGFKHGRNLHIQEWCLIDPGHCMLISVGNDVTIAPRCHILAHDASTKMYLGYTRIAETRLGNRVFVGAGTIILPGVTIGDDVIIGAGSVVTKDLSSGGVYVGNPAVWVKSTEEYLKSQREALEHSVVFDSSYTVDHADVSRIKELVKEIHAAGGESIH
jgi:maltose O-acetyltransferase